MLDEAVIDVERAVDWEPDGVLTGPGPPDADMPLKDMDLLEGIMLDEIGELEEREDDIGAACTKTRNAVPGPPLMI